MPDGLRLRQVLTNGLSNAMKHAQNVDLSVTVAAGDGSSGSASVVLRVLDDGPGLHGVDMAKLFDDFSAAANSVASGRRGEGVKGSGLGLPICGRLTALMGGTLTVRDRTDGTNGVEFTVTLPWRDLGPAVVARTPSPHALVPRDQNHSARSQLGTIHITLRALDRAAEKDAATTSATARARRILVVDDAPLNRRIAARYVQLLGHECVTLSDGDEVAAAVAAAPADVILMDIRMARIDGDVACRQLRAGGYTGPIIAVSTRAFLYTRSSEMPVWCVQRNSAASIRVFAGLNVCVASQFKSRRYVCCCR